MTLLVKIGTGPLASVTTTKRKLPVVGEKFHVKELYETRWLSVRCTDIKDIGGKEKMYMVERF